jgi:pre-mRNA-splicing helicase BRR2
MLDLEDLSFAQGGHFMANKKCELPEGSFRAPKKGYEEVHVPAVKNITLAPGERLIAIAELPAWAQPAFAGMKTLNRIQSRVCDTALYGADNMLMCAPTGAGKTNVAMLAILHEMGLHRLEDGGIELESWKIVYVAPMKALVAEVVLNLSARLKDFGVTVRELTGDIQLTKAQIAETQIIVTTPEKWDIITRKSGESARREGVGLTAQGRTRSWCG